MGDCCTEVYGNRFGLYTEDGDEYEAAGDEYLWSNCIFGETSAGENCDSAAVESVVSDVQSIAVVVNIIIVNTRTTI